MTGKTDRRKHPTRRAKRTEDTRRRILDASVRLFVEQGYEKTTTRQILQEVGILNGSLYNIYGSKEEIFADIILDALQDVVDQSSEFLPDDTPVAMRIGFLTSVQIHLAAKSPRIAELLMIAHEKWEIHRRVRSAVTEWVSGIDESNDLHTESPDFSLKLDACTAVTGVFVERICRDPESVDAGRAMSLATATVLGILDADISETESMTSGFMEVLGSRDFEVCGIRV